MNQAVQSFRGSQKAKAILAKLTDYPNVPRKKAKFFNFMKNSFRNFGVNDSMLEEIWIVIESFDKLNKQEPVNPNNTTNNSSQYNSTSNGIKRKLEEIQEPIDEIPSEQNQNTANDSQFDWITEIKNVCTKNQENQIKFKKLAKKVKH